MIFPGAVDRWTSYYTFISAALDRQRPRYYLGVHDTETRYAVLPHAGGSWWLLIGRNEGEVYDDVPLEQGAWHIRAADRRRPSWMRRSPVAMSDPNWTCRGIELVSHADYRAIGEPYTDWQYRCVREACRWLLTLLWPDTVLVAIGHGEVQADRSDPVAFDWARAGFTPQWVPELEGHLFVDQAPPAPAPGEEFMHLTDDELKEHVLPALWGDLPYAPFFGIASAWVAEYRQGRYRGRPLELEVEVPGTDVKYQRFEFGLVTFRASDASYRWTG